MSLLWGEPGNEALKAENEGRVWEPGYCGESLGARLGYTNVQYMVVFEQLTCV